VTTPFYEPSYEPPEPLFDYADGEEAPDPDQLLDDIRDLLQQYAGQQPDGGLTGTQTQLLVRAVDLLDDWLSAGYPLPYYWRHAGELPAEDPPDPPRPIQELPPL
jgi:hypothetical protein